MMNPSTSTVSPHESMVSMQKGQLFLPTFPWRRLRNYFGIVDSPHSLWEKTTPNYRMQTFVNRR